MPLGADCVRYTTLSLLRRARMHIQKLEEQEQRARQLKEKLRSKQQSLRRQLEQLRGLGTVGERERLRADSLDSSGLSSERSDSDQGKCPGVEGSGGMSGPGLLTGPLPVQRSWRWTWRAWCSEVRLSCCGASAQARSTATHTVAVPGYDPHRPERPLPSAHSVPSGQSPHRASRAAWSHCWNGLKGPCVGAGAPCTLLLAAGSPTWERGVGPPEPCRAGSLGPGHPPRHVYSTWPSCPWQQEASWALMFLPKQGPLAFAPRILYFH
nr:PREDICTED: max dimerization protein 3 isoform X2 [Bos mutus]